MNTRDLINEAIADRQRLWEEMRIKRERRENAKHVAILGGCFVVAPARVSKTRRGGNRKGIFEMRKIFQTETDWYSAESVEEVNRLRLEVYDYDQDTVTHDPPEEVPDDKMIEVTLQDGWDDGRDHPEWAESDPDASLERVQLGRHEYSKVKAPARVWAKYETGMICTTEF